MSCNNQQVSSPTDNAITENKNNKTMNNDSMVSFARDYTQAWSSQTPGNVAAHFAEDGSLKVNNGTPAVGRIAIAKVAESFMTAFPDMVLTMDSLPTTEKGTEYHWTLSNTNTGPNGTGKKVRISGVEIWQFDNKGLIKESKGSFDEDEYNRQLNEGVKN
jgi:nuclear transport factor 2 (NTF2) superfamily protein